MMYYVIRGDCNDASAIKNKLISYDALKRNDIGTERPVGYKGVLMEDKEPIKIKLLNGKEWPN